MVSFKHISHLVMLFLKSTLWTCNCSLWSFFPYKYQRFRFTCIGNLHIFLLNFLKNVYFTLKFILLIFFLCKFDEILVTNLRSSIFRENFHIFQFSIDIFNFSIFNFQLKFSCSSKSANFWQICKSFLLILSSAQTNLPEAFTENITLIRVYFKTD